MLIVAIIILELSVPFERLLEDYDLHQLVQQFLVRTLVTTNKVEVSG
jgi:hypothetical protein